MFNTVIGVMVNVFYIGQRFTKDHITGDSKASSVITALHSTDIGILFNCTIRCSAYHVNAGYSDNIPDLPTLISGKL